MEDLSSQTVETKATMTSKPLASLYLNRYTHLLAAHPLRTKAITTASLCFFQEVKKHPTLFCVTVLKLSQVLGSNIAHTPVKKPAHNAPVLLQLLARARVDLRAVKVCVNTTASILYQ